MLCAQESDKASRFHFEQDAVHYIAAHAFLRSLLARYLEIGPKEIRFEYGPHGKPALHQTHNTRRLRFNLSHSGGIALCAVSLNLEIGVDIEKRRDIKDWNLMAKNSFAREEWESLKSLPEEEQLNGFFKLWTQKEAYIKALGQGLSYPLQQFCVPYKKDDAPVLVYDRHDPRQHGRWGFHSIRISTQHSATLVAEGSDTLAKVNSWVW